MRNRIKDDYVYEDLKRIDERETLVSDFTVIDGNKND